MKTKAVCIGEPGGPETLSVREIDLPDPGPGQVLVDVEAAGLNRADVLQRRGKYPPPADVPQDVPGLEFAGTVRQLGSSASGFQVGDRVMGIVGGGAMATQVVTGERELMRVPLGLDCQHAAAIPEAFVTSYDALFLNAGLSMGETVLIHAVASGIGTAATQLAKATGANVAGTTRSADKIADCEALGLDVPIAVAGGNIAEQLEEKLTGMKANVVLDMVGAPYLRPTLKVMATEGRIVVIGVLGGSHVENFPLFQLMRNRIRLSGTVLRSRPSEQKASLTQKFARHCLPLFETGLVKPVVSATIPMADIQDAHRQMEANQTFGKLVMVW